MPAPIKPELQIRAYELAADPNLSAAEIHRLISSGSDGQAPGKIGYPSVVRLVREARARPEDLTAAGMAGRILTLLNRDLTRLEATSGNVDLERLDRIAKTLRTIEPIRPQSKRREEIKPEAQVKTLKDLSQRAAHADSDHTDGKYAPQNGAH